MEKEKYSIREAEVMNTVSDFNCDDNKDYSLIIANAICLLLQQNNGRLTKDGSIDLCPRTFNTIIELTYLRDKLLS